MTYTGGNNSHLWSLHHGDAAVVATALHSGHQIREELSEILALDEQTRLREEDPYTDLFARLAPNYLIPKRSRFEVDLNRPRNEAVYLGPEDAWGLDIWSKKPTTQMIEHSLAEFDQFYLTAEQLFTRLEQEFGYFVVLDLHSYNHHRKGPDKQFDDPELNPDVNIGTGTMERNFWAELVDHFIDELRSFDYRGRHLDVRENVKFRGRQLASWVHTNFPQSGCVLSVEFKKIFMDEWTGELDREKFERLCNALKSTIPALLEELQRR